MVRATAVVAGALGLTATGCGPVSPDDGAPVGRGAPDGMASTPAAAVRRVALDSGNWSTDTVNDAFGRAAAVSIGEARATLDRQGEHMRDATAEFPYDIRSRTTVEEMTVRGSGDRRQATVVTRTMVTGGGVRGEGYEYKVASATVDRTEEGWVISRWTLRH